jgi:signal transduction histidine kinase
MTAAGRTGPGSDPSGSAEPGLDRSATARDFGTAPVRVALGYAVFGTVWILVSDLLLHQGEPLPPRALAISLAKGLLFVALSAGVIYLLVKAAQRRLVESYRSLRASEYRYRQLSATLERRVRRRTEELQDAVHDLEAFTDSVSHDLRAPLRAIEGFGERLGERAGERLEPREKQHLARILEATAVMRRLIDDLLGLGRITRAPFVREPVDLAELARDVVTDLRRAHPGSSVEVIVPASLPAEGDAGLLRIALDNLLGNAWKFSARSERPRIEIGSAVSGETVEFFVRDNGAGFDPTYARKMFEPFQRFHSPEEFGGTGIGLATVRRIVRRHGGDIRGESAPGEGATFYFTLPRCESAEG